MTITKVKAKKTGPLMVDTHLLEEPLHLLRQVDESSSDFLDLVASIQKDGFWPSRPVEVTKDGATYIINDGMHRVAAARKLGLKQIPVSVTGTMTDGERLTRAVIANAVKVETRPVEYARTIKKLLEIHPGWTIVDAAQRVCKSEAWVQQRLKVASLTGRAAELVNNGKIPIQNGEALARLVKKGIELTEEIIGRAIDEPVGEFVPDMKRLASKTDAGPVFKFRPLKDVRNEYERAKSDSTTEAGYLRALAYVLSQDKTYLESKKGKTK